MTTDSMQSIVDELVHGVNNLTFAAPVAYVYNPLVYARANYDLYCERYGSGRKEIIFVGMNPGPWGMAQTGVPFGDGGMVRDWLGLKRPVGVPMQQHPKRPVQGFDCPRGEVSGQRLWGWIRSKFKTPQRFFARFWVANYCPLVFMEESGRNRTPDKLPKNEKKLLFEACDQALYRAVRLLGPRYVIGVGKFAQTRAQSALEGLNVAIGCITHPSPANPKANRGWNEAVEHELAAMGISI